MSATPTLDQFWSSDEVRELVLQVARDAGEAGFTAEDVRLRGWWASVAPRSLSATIASLVSHGRLVCVGDSVSSFRSSKSRRLGRYVLREGAL